jgi:hypothetical protein
MNFFNTSRFTATVTVRSAKSEGPETFRFDETQKAGNLGQSLKCNHCVRIAPPPNSNVMLVTAAGPLGNGFITEQNFGCKFLP